MAEQHEITVVRHGATEWSENGRHTGVTDLPLLPQGEDEARATGKLLAGEEFALVLSSPLQRARRTCELTGYGAQVEVTDDLREWDYGELEGLTTPQIRERHPGWTIWTGPWPGGEAIGQVAARAERVLARARAADGDVLLFGHGHILRVLLACYLELDPVEGRRFALGTATLTRLGWEHEYTTMRTFNARG